MKRNTPVRIIILGYGIRGRAYAEYAAEKSDEVTLAAVADPVAEIPSIPGCTTYRRWEDALTRPAGEIADAVVISLPDRLHYPAAIKALALGYHVLLEKPLGCSWRECEGIRTAQQTARRIVLTGYVLRYSGFYRRLAQVITSGVIGELTNIHHLVSVSFGKAAHAFCRGNWAVEAQGTGMLVNKCTHDFDLIEWWTGRRRMQRLASCGSLQHWRPENRPAGAAERCLKCPAEVRAECPFDAYRLYYDRKDLRYHFADTSDAAILSMLEHSPYGRCVYACGNDSVDHQTVLMEYDGGLTVTLEMESYSSRRERLTHIYGTRGEIYADEQTIRVQPFLGEPTVITPEQDGNHGGGDREIMAEFVRLIRSASPDRYAKILDGALESHRLAFLAEDSRRHGKMIV